MSAHLYTLCGAWRSSSLPRRSSVAPLVSVVHDEGREIVGRALVLRQVQVLTPSRASTKLEGRHYGRRRVGRVDEVRVCAIRTGRIPVRPAGHVVEPGERPGKLAESGVARVRPGLALLARAEVDHVRQHLPDVRVAQSPAPHHPRSEALGDHVRLPLSNDIPDQLQPFRTEPSSDPARACLCCSWPGTGSC